MTEIQKWENVGAVATAGVTRLVDWAQEADAAYTLAHKLTSTAFCPEAFRGKPADAAAAMLAGGELGLSPLAALGAFDVIQGRASARAITLRALVQSRGHEIVLIESTDTRCRMKGRRAGSTEWQTVTWTIDRAKSLKLTGKSNWQQQPAAMLIARATSELCRLIASDAILGLGGGYSSEEVADGAVDAPPVSMEVVEAGPRKMSRRKPAEPEPAAEPPEPPVDSITDAQLRKLHAAFNDAGISDREERLAFASSVVGRDLGSSKDLTKGEAARVIDWLEAPAADEPEALTLDGES